MENALWNGKLVRATEIAENYAVEKTIRKASGRKELCCPDPECQHPILRYCHGEIKGAFFAHLNKETCDYAAFDKEDTQVMRTIRRSIYESFRKKGYNVQLEVKILPHHYTHLLFELADGNRVAVEIGTQLLSASRIDEIADEYKKEDIAVKWIVIGNTDTLVRENQTFFLKRYLLNESRNKDLLVVDWDCSEVAQYKSDPNKYIYKGESYISANYPETYVEYGTLDALVFDDNNELTFVGYDVRYQAWIIKKQAVFNKKIVQLEDENREHMEAIELQKQLIKESKYLGPENSAAIPASRLEIKQAKPDKTYEKRKKEIISQMSQQDTQVRDSIDIRWVKCEICGRIDTVDEFITYGGRKHMNLGECYDCKRKKDS